MKFARPIVWLLILTVLCVGVHVALTTCGGETQRVVRRSTLTRIADPDRVTDIALETAGAQPAILKREISGWRLEQPYVTRANDESVMKLLDAIVSTPVNGNVITDAELLKMGRTRENYGLDKPFFSVSLNTAKTSARVDFGMLAADGGGVYVAVGDEDAVFLMPTQLLAAVQVPIERLRDRSVFDLDPKEVSSFDIKQGTAPVLHFVRDGLNWRIGEKLAAEVRVQELLDSVREAKSRGFVWPVGTEHEAPRLTEALMAAYGIDSEAAVTLTAKGEGSVSSQISFGNATPDGGVYSLVQNSSAIVIVDHRLRDLVAQKGDAFEDSRLFPYDPTAVSSFSVQDGDAVYAAARDAQGTWRLDAPIAAPADAGTAQTLVDRLVSLTSRDLRSEGLTVAVMTNRAPVIVSRVSLLAKLRLEDLRAKDILRIDPVLVKRLVQTAHGGRQPMAVVSEREHRVWRVESADAGLRKTNDKAINGILEVLNPLLATRIEKVKVSPGDLACFGLNAPWLTLAVDIDREDAVRRNIIIGSPAPGGRYATVGSSDAVFVLPEATVRKLAAEIVGR